MNVEKYSKKTYHWDIYEKYNRMPLAEALDHVKNDPIPDGRCALGILIYPCNEQDHARILDMCAERGLRVIDHPEGVYPDCRPRYVEAYQASGMIAMQHSEAVCP